DGVPEQPQPRHAPADPGQTQPHRPGGQRAPGQVRRQGPGPQGGAEHQQEPERAGGRDRLPGRQPGAHPLPELHPDLPAPGLVVRGLEDTDVRVHLPRGLQRGRDLLQPELCRARPLRGAWPGTTQCN
ncbi:unnamed protein product, partial [Heterosigma akashiwo]